MLNVDFHIITKNTPLGEYEIQKRSIHCIINPDLQEFKYF